MPLGHFLALLYFSICSLVCVCGLCLSDPSSFKASVRGRSQTPPSLFHSISLSLFLSFFLVLSLTFENKSLEFEFQSERARGGFGRSRRRG